MKLRCKNCNEEFEITEDDVDIDYDIEKIDRESVDITITISVRCPKCGRRIIEGSETVTIPIKIRGETS